MKAAEIFHEHYEPEKPRTVSAHELVQLRIPRAIRRQVQAEAFANGETEAEQLRLILTLGWLELQRQKREWAL
jgi:hypothetical protein